MEKQLSNGTSCILVHICMNSNEHEWGNLTLPIPLILTVLPLFFFNTFDLAHEEKASESAIVGSCAGSGVKRMQKRNRWIESLVSLN